MKPYEVKQLRVTNVTPSGVARGHKHFPAGETVDVLVTSRAAYVEITACRWLRYEILDDPGTVASSADDATPQGDGYPTDEDESLSKMTVPQLREVATKVGLDIPKSAKKAEIIDALEAAYFLAANAGDGDQADEDEDGDGQDEDSQDSQDSQDDEDPAND